MPVAVWPNRYVKGWESGGLAGLPLQTSTVGEVPEAFPALDLKAALLAEYDTDAHFVPYHIKGCQALPRINAGGLAVLNSTGSDLAYDAIAVDIDTADHNTDHSWSAGQLALVRSKLPALWASAGWYLTKGGARLVWQLSPSLGRAEYLSTLGRLAGLLTSIGVAADLKAVKDFNRCYRLPYVLRDGEPQRLPMDLSRLGPLDISEIPTTAADFAEVDQARLGPFALPAAIEVGSRDSTLTAYAGALRRQGLDPDAILAALRLINADRVSPPMAEVDLIRIAKSVGRYEPEPRAVRQADREAVGGTFIVSPGDLPELIRRSESLLANEGLGVYQRNGDLVNVWEDPAPEGSDVLIKRIKDGALRTMLGTLANWARYKKKGEEYELSPIDVPVDVVKGLADATDYPSILPLVGITQTPTLRPDGTVLDATGYDSSTGIYFAAPKGLIWPVIADQPSKADAEVALKALAEVFIDFPFLHPTHYSVAIAAVLTAVARPAIKGATPLFLFDATTPGSGKGLLAHAVSLISTGGAAGVMVQTREEETEKRITSVLAAGSRVILLDNIDRPLGGAAMDAAITSEVWQGRLLGKSEMIRLANDALWIATGNNIEVKGDLARRCLRVYLVPDTEKPDERVKFVHPDLLGWIKQHRGRLVGAALTLLRAYIVAGSPRVTDKPFGGFGAWSGLVRSALVWAGAPDPCVTRTEIREQTDSGGMLISGLLQVWRDTFGSEPYSARAAVELARSTGFGGGVGDATRSELYEALADVAGDERGEISAKKLGQVLKRNKGRIIGGLRIEKVTRGRAGIRWVIAPVF